MVVYCNKCGKTFTVIHKIQKHGSVDEVYFVCTHCKKHYTSYYSNKTISRLQDELTLLQKRYINAKSKDKNKIENKLINTKKKLKNAMDKLRKKMDNKLLK